MLNNYELNFKLRELLASYFSNKKVIINYFNQKKHAYWLGSGRDSIFLILKDIEKKIGVGEIICPNYSCKAIPRAIIKAGFTPIFIDLDKTLSLDENNVKKAINDKTKGIIYYHPWGFLHNEKIKKLAKKNKILLIEDCAQTIGKNIGKTGDYSFFSFRTSKLIGVGSGSILLSNKKIDYQIKKSSKLIQFVDLKDLIFRSKIANLSKPRAIFEKIFENIDSREIGGFQKRLLKKELIDIDRKINIRIKNYNILKKVVDLNKNLENIKLNRPISPLYFAFLSKNKDTDIKLLKQKGINARGYYNFVNSDIFSNKYYGDSNSRYFSKRIINLPLHDKLSDTDIDKIVEAIKSL